MSIPNLLALIRLILTPVAMALIVASPGDAALSIAATIVFAVAAITDFLAKKPTDLIVLSTEARESRPQVPRQGETSAPQRRQISQSPRATQGLPGPEHRKARHQLQRLLHQRTPRLGEGVIARLEQGVKAAG